MSAEAKVGAVFLLCVAVLVVGWVQLTGGLEALNTYTVAVHFADLSGLLRGAPVRLQGVDIGKVAQTGLSYDARFPTKPAAAWLRISKRYRLYRGYVFRIASGSLMGDKYVDVSVGPRRGALLGHGDHVAGAEPKGFEALAQRAEELTEKASTLIDNINVFAADPALLGDLQFALRNLRETSQEGVRIANDLSRFARALPDPSRVDLARVNDILENVHEASRSMRAAAAGINALMATSTIPQDVAATVESMREAGASIERTAQHIETTVTSPELEGTLRDTAQNLRTLTERSLGTMDRVDGLLEDSGHIVGRVQGGFERLDRLGHNVATALDEFEYEAHADLQYGSQDRWRSDVNVDIYPDQDSERFWRVGIRDFGDHEALNLQLGLPLGHDGDERLRLGFVGGSLGGGWDKEWTPRIGSEVEAHHPDRLQLDLRGKYHYNDDWDILLGVDSLFDRNSLFVGARYNLDF